MAVVPIVKVRVLSYRSDATKMLEIAQKMGVIEFKKIEENDGFLTEVLAIDGKSSETLLKINQALSFLREFEAKIGTFEGLKQGSLVSLSEKQLNEQVFKTEQLETILATIKQTQARLVEKQDQIRLTIEIKNNISPWAGLSVPIKFLNTRRTRTHLVRFKKNSAGQDTLALLTNNLQEAKIEVYIERVSSQLASFTINNSPAEDSVLLSKIKEFGGEIVHFPDSINATIAEEMSRLEQKLQTLNDEEIAIKTEVTLLVKKNIPVLKLTHDSFFWHRDQESVFGVAKVSKRLVVFEGWANQEILPKFQTALAKDNLLCEVTKVPLQENEVPPVEIRNNPLFRPFEVITRLNGLPSHKDIDPTPFMAVFFFIFFGLCLTDVGYGALLMLSALPFIVYFKISPIAKQFSQLIFLVGLSTVIIGLFFGGYFGIEMSAMPKFLQDLQQFDPIGNPLPVFYLALALGVLQVMTGMVLKIVSEAKNGELMKGVLDQGPWLFLFITLIMYGASALSYLAIPSEKIVVLIYVAIAAVILASGRTGKTFFGKIQMSLLSIYNSINYLSDVLSYSRLLALGLATSALAFAVNLIAGIVYDMIPYVGAVLAVVVLIVGHIFTLVINTLGSFIHSARLQFVEFFGKFITGTGREFRPLSRKEAYVSLIKEESG